MTNQVKKIKRKKASHHCRFCRGRIEGHGRKLYCDKDPCQQQYARIRKKQKKAAKKRFIERLKKKKAINKKEKRVKQIDSIKIWIGHEQ